MNKVRVGVIGTGHLGTIHARLWKNNDDIDFTGIYDASPERALQVAGEFNCNRFENLDELLQNCDAVTIAAPTSNHFEISKHCIESGVHCLIEKPITQSYSEAKLLIELAEKNKISLQVGHVERFNPAIAALKDYPINPVFIEAHRLSQFKPRATDVSVVHDLMIHDIDIILWLIKSKVEKIDANGVSVVTGSPDIANARITFKNGAVANLTASRITARPMRKMRIFQKFAYFSIDFGKQDVEIFRLKGEIPTGSIDAKPATMLGSIDLAEMNSNIVFEKPEIPKINAIEEEQRLFAESVRNNTPIAVTASEAAEALRIAEEISNMIENSKIHF